MNNINIMEGSITFWTNVGQIEWSGVNEVILFERTFGGNSILISKDSDARLQFSYVYLGKGRRDVALDVSNLQINTRHFIAATWSITQNEIILSVDGGKQPDLIKKGKIDF